MKSVREQAMEIRRSRAKLRKRITSAISLLKSNYQVLFDRNRTDLFSFDEARIYSKCGKYALQWCAGDTNTGSVYFTQL